MISSDLRGLLASMKAHVECDQMNAAFFAVFYERAKDLALQVEQLELSIVPPHQRRASPRLHHSQLELIKGGRS